MKIDVPTNTGIIHPGQYVFSGYGGGIETKTLLVRYRAGIIPCVAEIAIIEILGAFWSVSGNTLELNTEPYEWQFELDMTVSGAF